LTDASRTRVVHIASTHSPLDVRIFEKECRSLARTGYEVHFVVPGPPEAERDHVFFHDLAKPAGGLRPFRIFRRLFAAYRAAKSASGAIYHFHECELIPVGCALKLSGAKVIYDVHEHYPFEAFSANKGRPLRAVTLSLAWTLLEMAARVSLDGFVAATPYIAGRFPARRTVLVQNFPILADFRPATGTAMQRGESTYLAYIGGISPIRGIREIVAALGLLPADSPVRLRLLGNFSSGDFERELRSTPGWSRVDYLGFLPRGEAARQLQECAAGLVLYLPERDHVDAQPNKLFEYMAAGLPIIASNFPLWREYVEGRRCGIVVDPTNPRAILRAIERLLADPVDAAEMGARGRRAAETMLNWAAEEGKLLALYHRLVIASAT
jgi:glycosyltransferase involved in cell wall biosynthesis